MPFIFISFAISVLLKFLFVVLLPTLEFHKDAQYSQNIVLSFDSLSVDKKSLIKI